MGKKKICEKCGKKYKDSFKQKLERKGVIQSLKRFKIAGISDKHEETKNFCYDCWKVELKSMMKPFAQALGQSAESW